MDETSNLASHLERSPLIHGYGYAHYNESAGGRSSNLLCQLAPKIQILHAICGLSKSSVLYLSWSPYLKLTKLLRNFNDGAASDLTF